MSQRERGRTPNEPNAPKALLAAILLFAALLRVIFFVGLVSGDPQDDGVYYGHALTLYQQGPTGLERFRHLPPDFLPNPVDQFDVRPMVTYPIAAAFAAFGPGEVAATLWTFACSMLTVLIVFQLGREVHDTAVGLLAALLCAFYPLEVINGSRILSDVPVGFFCALAFWLFVRAGRRSRPRLYALAGAAVGGAYLANARGLIFLVAIVACATGLAMLRKVTWRAPALVMAGFVAVFTVEALAYYVATGEPFLSYRIQTGAAAFKYLREPVSSFLWGRLRVSYNNGQPLELVRSVLLLDVKPANQFGLFFYLFAASAVFSLIKRRNLLLLALAAGLCVYLEFGPVRLSFDSATRELNYMMVFKQERFLMMVTAPFAVMSADLLRRSGRKNRIVAIIVVTALLVTSIAVTRRTRDHYRSGLQDLREAVSDVRAHPDRVFFGDFWAIEHLKIFTRYQAGNLRVLTPHTAPDELAGACVMLGGSRGVELLADYVEQSLPPFAREVLNTGTAPEGWTLVKNVSATRNGQRLHDFRIYCLPSAAEQAAVRPG